MFGRLLLAMVAIGLPVWAQTQDHGAGATGSSAPVVGTNSTKKVLTNDDLGGNKSAVSVVGDKRNQNYHL
ncbi:MAG: hypothetical protein WBR26_14710, partial [Candidatus Acidiferrum sp.]